MQKLARANDRTIRKRHDDFAIGAPNKSVIPRQSNWLVIRLAAQTHHYIDAGDLVSIWRHRSFADDHIGRGNIHKLMPILDIEVMMFGSIGVKIRFCTIAQ